MFNTKKFNEINDFLKKTSNPAKIVAISKNHPLESVLHAINSGVRIFGENRVQEAQDKFQLIKQNNPNIKLHLTGPLQSRKVKTAIPLFDVFHTLDREKIANEFSKNRHMLNGKEIFIQVNTGEEDTKSGIIPKHLTAFINFCRIDKKLNIVGLMCIPPINDTPSVHFQMLKNLANKNNLKQLSIGMSNDYKEAIEFSPSYIRLGTILFGTRN